MRNPASNKEMKIAIVGAGPGGLALALTLQQYAFSNVAIFERSSELPCTRGGTIRIDGKAQAAMKEMELSTAPALTHW